MITGNRLGQRKLEVDGRASLDQSLGPVLLSLPLLLLSPLCSCCSCVFMRFCVCYVHRARRYWTHVGLVMTQLTGLTDAYNTFSPANQVSLLALCLSPCVSLYLSLPLSLSFSFSVSFFSILRYLQRLSVLDIALMNMDGDLMELTTLLLPGMPVTS